MALVSTYIQTYGQIKNFFSAIREGQAPRKFSRQYLKDLGFKSSNHHALIPLLKNLGFLTDDGSPTPRYFDYIDKSKSTRVLTEAIADAYSDIFAIKSKPTNKDKDIVEGKFKSFFNSSNRVAQLRARTFFSLLSLCDLSFLEPRPPKPKDEGQKGSPDEQTELETEAEAALRSPVAVPAKELGTRPVALSYNIQIHLPPTKDIEVYNAIFRSLKEHLIE